MSQGRALSVLGYLILSVPVLALASQVAGDGWTWWDERPWQAVWLFCGVLAVAPTLRRK